MPENFPKVAQHLKSKFSNLLKAIMKYIYKVTQSLSIDKKYGSNKGKEMQGQSDGQTYRQRKSVYLDHKNK